MKCPVCGSSEKQNKFDAYRKCYVCICLFIQKPPNNQKLKDQVDIDADIMLSSNGEDIPHHI